MTGEITYLEAIRAAIADAMREDERVFLLGEEVDLAGGVKTRESVSPQRPFPVGVFPGQPGGLTQELIRLVEGMPDTGMRGAKIEDWRILGHNVCQVRAGGVDGRQGTVDLVDELSGNGGLSPRSHDASGMG